MINIKEGMKMITSPIFEDIMGRNAERMDEVWVFMDDEDNIWFEDQEMAWVGEEVETYECSETDIMLDCIFDDIEDDDDVAQDYNPEDNE